MRKDRIQAIVGCTIIGVAVLVVTMLLAIPGSMWENLREATGLQQGTPERHLVPRDYQGWVTVRYGVAGAPALQTEDGMLIFRYPKSGILETSSEWKPGMKRKEYYLYGEPELAAIARRGPDRRIWGERDIVIKDDAGMTSVDHRSSFFVGTSKAYRQAQRLAPHFTPELTELMNETNSEADRAARDK